MCHKEGIVKKVATTHIELVPRSIETLRGEADKEEEEGQGVVLTRSGKGVWAFSEFGDPCLAPGTCR